MAAVLAAVPGVAFAWFSSQPGSQTSTFTAGTLDAPTTPTTIHPNVSGSGTGDVTLSWTDTLTRDVTYLVQRAPATSPTTWATVNGSGAGTPSSSLCTGSVPGTVSCTYQDSAAGSTSAPAYNEQYVYQVVSEIGGFTATSASDLAQSLPPASGTETFLAKPDLNAVSATDASDVWAVGAYCAVDYFNGTTWVPQTVPTSVCPTGTALYGVAANGGTPLIVGADGVAFICTASCTTSTPAWSVLSTAAFGSPTLYAVSANATNNVWVAGANCTALFFNGSSWTAQPPGTGVCPSGTDLYGVAENSKHPVYVGSGGLVFTCTGACNATPTYAVNAVTGLTGSPTFYAAASNGNVWTVGTGGTVAVCTGGCGGGGAAWVAVPSGTTATLRAVFPQNSGSLVVVAGDGGTLLTCTANCNKNNPTWSAQSAGVAADLYGITAPDGTHTYAVGTRGTVVSNNGWATITTSVSADLNAISATDASNVWAVGANCTVGYFNGSTWTLQAVSSLVCPSGTTLYGVAANGGSPMVVGANGVTFVCATDCATAAPVWTSVSTALVGSPTLYAVSANANNSIWAAGANCAVLYFNGIAWVDQTPGSAYCPAGTVLHGVAQNNKHPVYAGDSGLVLTCTGGCNATPSYTVNTVSGLSGSPAFYAAGGDDGKNPWAVGANGTVAVCTGGCGGGGATWTVASSATTSALRAVYQQNSGSLVVVAGDGGTLLTCTANCNKNNPTWSAQSAGVAADLNGITAPDSTHTYAVGRGGRLIAYGTGATVQQASNLPGTAPTSYTLAGADVTAMSTGDSSTYTGQGQWPSGNLPSTCSSAVPGVQLVPSPIVPSGTWTISRAVATVTFSTTTTPSADAAFQLLVSADGGSTWAAYPLTKPSAAGTSTTTTVTITPTISTTTALQGMQLCFQGASGTGPRLTSSLDLVHVDIN